MTSDIEFNFADNSIAEAYDQVLVPLLFNAWTERLISENGPWSSRYVLDLACGTGVVTQQLLHEVTCKGKVYALDLNEEMLSINKSKFEELGCEDAIEFMHASAESIPIDDDTLDVVVCQQGFQFFPDHVKAAREIYRVLSKGGRLIASTWLPVSSCAIMGTLCETLETIGESELSQLMRMPFDYMPRHILEQAFEKAGFESTNIEEQHIDLILKGGLDEAVAFVYGTPIGPKLRALTPEKKILFEQKFREKVAYTNETNFGPMTTHVLNAQK